MALTYRITHKPDFLAFSLILYLLIRWRASGHNVRGVLEIIAVDAMVYFMVIFTSHFVLAMTLYFGRVSPIGSSFRPYPTSSNAHFSRTRSNFFQRCKLLQIYYPTRNPPNHTFCTTAISGNVVCVPRLACPSLSMTKDHVRYLPVMISRIMLSLKKSAGSRSADWSLGETYHTSANAGSVMKFARPAKRAGTEQDGIPLDTYSWP